MAVVIEYCIFVESETSSDSQIIATDSELKTMNLFNS